MPCGGNCACATSSVVMAIVEKLLKLTISSFICDLIIVVLRVSILFTMQAAGDKKIRDRTPEIKAVSIMMYDH